MEGLSDIVLLQRYRRDRRELLNFLLSASVLKKVVMPPGAVSLDDIDLDQISVDYTLHCARKNDVLDLSEAIRVYHEDLSLPPTTGSGLGQVYFLATQPPFSGPPPKRPPPAIPFEPPPVVALPRTYSLRPSSVSNLSQLPSSDAENDEEETEEEGLEISRRQLNDASDLVLCLPPFATGLSEDDLRETAYEVLLVSVGAAGGLISPAKVESKVQRKSEKKSKIVKRFTRTKSEKHVPQQPLRATGLAGLTETMRTQLEISEAADRRTREALLHAVAGRVGKRMDTLLVPLELLCSVSKADFPDRKLYMRWQKRQINLLEEGLLNLPTVRLESSDRMAAQLRVLMSKLEEAETIPAHAGATQQTETLKAMRDIAGGLAERANRRDHTGEVCHWADGYHLNVRLYEKLLSSVFDVLDEGQIVEEVEEILEILKSTWRVLGITQTVHDTCYTWVFFRQYVLTGEPGLLKHAIQQMKRIASDAQRSTSERAYMQCLRATVEGSDGPQEYSYVQSVLMPIKSWADKKLDDYHSHFSNDASMMDAIVTVAMVSGRLIADENAHTGITRMTPSAEMAAVAKQAEDYIWSSVKLAYERVLETVDARSEAESEHPLALLAEEVQALALQDSTIFAPILSRWHPQAVATTASLLHGLYQKELKPFLDGVSHLTDDVASVLPAADSLEQYLLGLVISVADLDDASNNYEQQMVPYQVEVVSGTLIMRWVNMQLSKVAEWVDRTILQEKWEGLSSQQRYGESVVEVFRIIEETVDQFFNLKLPMRVPLLKGLTNGLDNALQLYCKGVVSELGETSDLIPPVPSLTRYKKDGIVKVFSKKKVADPRLPDEKRSSEINLLTTAKLCVRLNTLHYVLAQVDSLEDNIRERWAVKRPLDDLTRSNGHTRRRPSDGDMKAKRLSGGRQADELSASFEGSRKAANMAIDRLCEFTGTKIIFWDMRETFIDGLYKGSVAHARMEKVVNELDPVLGQLCSVIIEPLRDRVVLGLLHAAVEGLLRVLLDGGQNRAFDRDDSDMLEEDFNLLKEFFIADGDGLPRGVVDNASNVVQQVLALYSLEAFLVIESFKRAGEQMVAGGTLQKMGGRSATDADTLLRVLCHRMDRDAAKFLKKQYKMPS